MGRWTVQGHLCFLTMGPARIKVLKALESAGCRGAPYMVLSMKAFSQNSPRAHKCAPRCVKLQGKEDVYLLRC